MAVKYNKINLPWLRGIRLQPQGVFSTPLRKRFY